MISEEERQELKALIASSYGTTRLKDNRLFEQEYELRRIRSHLGLKPGTPVQEVLGKVRHHETILKKHQEAENSHWKLFKKVRSLIGGEHFWPSDDGMLDRIQEIVRHEEEYLYLLRYKAEGLKE